jgi:uncharacterized protein Smg (DUF494 family)
MKNVDTNKWYNNPNKELTLENAKEFFFDFECNPNIFVRDGIYQDWIELNIPQEILISWTTEYYRNDLSRYSDMDLSNKLSYCKKISGILDQFEKPIIIRVSNKYIRLFSNKEIEKLNKIKKRRIAQTMLQYFNSGIIYKKNTSKEIFTGYIPKLLEINEFDLASRMIHVFVNFLLQSPEAFYGNDISSLTYYYEILMKVNHKYNLKLDSVIDRLKA